MKIVDLKVIPFWVPRKPYYYGEILPETRIVQTVTKIITDEGAEGYCFGGFIESDQDGLPAHQRAFLEDQVKPLVLGQDPYDPEKIWHWMWVANMPENILSVLDMALWDLQARAFDVPVHKLLGGCREKVKAYASTNHSMGAPEVYAQHALECKSQGYRAYKIHPLYHYWDPVNKRPDLGRP